MTNLRKSLEARGVLVRDLVTDLLMIKAFTKQMKEDNRPELLFLAKEQLRASQTIDDVFIILSSYISFFNYEIIERIVNIHGHESDRENLREYLSRFKEFCHRRAHEKIPLFVDCLPEEPTCTVLKVKVESDFPKDYTVRAITLFRAKLCEILGVTEPCLRLLSIEEGCILLTFFLPKFVVPHVFPLSSDQKTSLKSNGVVKCALDDEELIPLAIYKRTHKIQKVYAGSSSSFEQFGQRRPPLSVTIRGILERYPDGQIFKVASSS